MFDVNTVGFTAPTIICNMFSDPCGIRTESPLSPIISVSSLSCSLN